VLGKHSGRRALEARLRQLGLAPEGLALDELLAQVRDFSQVTKQVISDEELLLLCRSLPRVA
jgi:homocitrate synthase NifV